MITAIIGSILFSIVIVLYILLALGLPYGERLLMTPISFLKIILILLVILIASCKKEIFSPDHTKEFSIID